jgi:hypothetical protein
LADDPDVEAFPAVLVAFYAPIALLIERLAADTSRTRLDRAIEVMTALIDRIAELGIVRVQEFDEGGRLVGMDRDVAAYPLRTSRARTSTASCSGFATASRAITSRW